jgi:hypothetical protein
MKPKIPLKWKIRWFLQGMASVFGYKLTREQSMREIRQCKEEMLKNHAN